jgi:uncharacterized repeat protein (TIGR01451 family)
VKDDVTNEDNKANPTTDDLDSSDPDVIDVKPSTPRGSIGDYVFLDKDGSNTQTAGDEPVAGVKVYLLDAAGVKIDSTITGTDGKYLFSNLPLGTYSVQFVAPAGQSFVTKDTGADDKDSDAGTDGKTAPVTLTAATPDVMTLDAGLKPQTSKVFDLAIRKDLIGTGPFKPGDNVTFNVTVFNQGNVAAYAVEVTDYIPAGMSLNDATWTAAGANATKILAGPIAANGSVQVPITLKIDAGFTGTNLTNVVEITKADDDTNPSNTPPTDIDSTPGNKVPGEDDIDQEPIPFQPTPPNTPIFDLALTKKVVSSGPFEVGDLVTFEISVLNQGSVAAYNVEVSDRIPTGLILQDAAWTQSGTNATQTIAGPIAVGGSAVKTITFKIDPAFAGTKIENVAEITKADDDTNPNNTPPTDKDSTPDNKVPTEDDQDKDVIELTPPTPPNTPVFDLALVKKHTGATPYAVGDTVTYTLAVINQGTVAAYGVEVTDYIPTGMTLADAAWTASGTTAKRTIAGPIAAGTTQLTTIKLRIDPTFTGTSIKNVAEISKADNDTNPANTPPVDKDGTLDNNPANNGPVKDDVTNEDNKANPTTDDLDSSDPDVIDVKPSTPRGSIGDYVWKDENANGLQDATEKGIKDVKVELYKTDATGALVGAAIQTATTLADGKYLFDSLASGTYKVKFITSSLPADCRALTKKDATPNDDTKDSDVDPATGLSPNVTINAGGTGIAKDNTTIDAGVLQAYGSIGDVVWKDANGDGLQGTTTLEPGIKDVRVELYLADVSGNPQLSPIKTKRTDVNGKYLFDSLPSGDYFVKFITSTFPADCNTLTKKDATPNDDTKDSDADALTGFSQRVTIVATGTGITKDNPTIDAGLLPTFGSLGDYVWKDRNGNGIQDATEKGAKGVTVELYTVSSTGVVSTTPLKTAITDSNGKYLFDSLKKGDYKVKFVTATLPADCNKLTSKDKGTDDAKDSDADPTTGFSPTVSIDPSGTGLTKNNPTIDAGIVPLLGSIGDYVWKDKNGNGIQDLGELPVKDVKVELYVSNAAGIPQGAPIRTVTTGANGKYLFDSLDKGDYTVKFITSSLPADCNKLTPQNKGGDPAKDSDADPGTGFTPKVSIDPADPTKRDITTVDAGILQAYATIGDYVWKDTNANGVQDILEKGIKDVVVELYATVNGVPNATPLKTVKTDANGKYTFDSLLSGTYKVKFITSSLPKDCNTLTKANQGSDTAKDSDVDPLTGFSQNVTLDAGGTGLAKDNPTIDAGVIPTYGSIGNYVWKDEDKNGIQGPLEKGVKDVTVQLFKADAQGNPVGAALKTVKTDANGKYLFDSLASGDYVVKFQTVGLPADCNKYTDVLQGTPATDSNANPTTGLSPKITINTNGTGLAKDNDSIDAGLLPTPSDPNSGCPIDAGPDQKICAPESTAKVVAANTKQVWSFIAGPVVASITQSGNITGMIRRGTYKFVLTGIEPGVTCKDTLIIKRGILDVADVTTCESVAKLTAAPAGHTWALASGNPAAVTITQAGAVSGMTTAGVYRFVIINATCTDTAFVVRTPGPDYTANVTAATCDGLTPRVDGKIILTGYPTGAKADYSAGATYTGTKTGATATAIPAGGVIVSNLASPTASISQTYTVRVWDVAGCFTDKIVQLIKTDCACPPPKCIPFEMTVIKKK